jgi:hypothetical protein
MNNYKIFKILLFLFLLVPIGCSRSDHSNNGDPVFTEGDVNETIIVTIPDDCNIFKINAEICIVVILQGKNPVIISSNGMNAFKRNNDKWVSIDNGDLNKSYRFTLYPSYDYSISSKMLLAQPRFDDKSAPITLRFVVTGNLYQNEKMGEKVSAYVDVTLNP